MMLKVCLSGVWLNPMISVVTLIVGIFFLEHSVGYMDIVSNSNKMWYACADL